MQNIVSPTLSSEEQDTTLNRSFLDADVVPRTPTPTSIVAEVPTTANTGKVANCPHCAENYPQLVEYLTLIIKKQSIERTVITAMMADIGEIKQTLKHLSNKAPMEEEINNPIFEILPITG